MNIVTCYPWTPPYNVSMSQALGMLGLVPNQVRGTGAKMSQASCYRLIVVASFKVFSLAFLDFEFCPCFVAAICNYCMFMYDWVHLPRRNVLFKWNSFKPVLAALILFQLTHMSNVHEVYGCFLGPATTFAWIQSALLKPYDHLGLQIWFAASHLKLSNIYLMSGVAFQTNRCYYHSISYTPRTRSYLPVTSPTSLLSSLSTYFAYSWSFNFLHRSL